MKIEELIKPKSEKKLKQASSPAYSFQPN